MDKKDSTAEKSKTLEEEINEIAESVLNPANIKRVAESTKSRIGFVTFNDEPHLDDNLNQYPDDPTEQMIKGRIDDTQLKRDKESSLPSSTIIHSDGTIEYQKSELIDPRLEMLFSFGMPRELARVATKYQGDFFSARYKDYGVEILGVRLDKPANPDGDEMIAGGASYYRRNDGKPGVMHHWLRRLLHEGTASTIEDLWHPKFGWLTLIANNEHPYRLVREVKQLADGFLFLRMLDAHTFRLGRPDRSGEIDHVSSYQMERVLSFLCAYYQGHRSDFQELLAGYFNVSRWTISRYFKAQSLNWRETLQRAKARVPQISQDSFRVWRKAYDDGDNPIDF